MNEIVHPLTDAVLRYLVIGSVVALVLVLLALAVLNAARVRTPVYRHMVWLYCLMGIVGLPLVWLYGPKLRLAVLPAHPEIHESSALPRVGPEVDALALSHAPAEEMLPARQERTFSWKTAAAAVWLVGLSIMFTRLAVGWTRLRQICRSAVPLHVSAYPPGVAKLRLTLCLTSELQGPVCFGVFRPIILLPQDMYHGGSPENLRMVLTHELAHIERRDGWANLFQRLVEAIYFFHPLVWLASRQLTQQREEICDNYVLAEGISADDYTTLLSHLGTQGMHARYLQTVALFEGQLLSRIRSLLDPSRSRQTRLPWRVATICTATVLAGFLILGSVRLAARPSDRAIGASSASKEQDPTQAQSTSVAEGASRKSTQPRYPARTFNSEMAFTVRYLDRPGWTRNYTQPGRTPRSTPLQIPACWLWWVQLEDAAIDWDLLVREIRENRVPGLAVSRATDPDVGRLADLPGLRLLDLEGSQITDAGLTYLKKMSGLEVLHLSRTEITDAGLAHLKGLTGLRQLQLNRVAITDAGLKHLQNLTALQRLDLGGTGITDEGLTLLKDLIRLQSLTLGGTQITGGGLEHLKGLPELEELWLGISQMTDASLEHLKGVTTLHTLWLSNTKITDAGLAHLKNVSGLQRLELQGTQVSGAGLPYLNDLPKLKYLGLARTQVTDAGLENLKGLVGLEGLRLPSQITDAGLERLKALLSGLTELYLSDTQITDLGLEHLKSLPRLRILRLENTKTTDAGLAHLTSLSGMEWLYLSGTEVTDAGIRRLKQSLPNLTVVGQPQPARQDTDEPAQSTRAPMTDSRESEQPRYSARTFNSQLALEVWVQETSTLWSMRRIGSTPSGAPLEIPACWLWGVRLLAPLNDWDLFRREMNQNEVPGLITQRAVDSDLRQLAGLTTLRLLDLSASEITDVGLEYLKDMSALEQLNLQRTKITDTGMGDLKALTNLKTLIVGWTGITDAGLEHLKGMTGLQTLMLQASPITDLGMEHIKDISTLQSLTLGGTKITDAGLEHIKAMSELQDLMLQGTSITDKGLAHLKGLTKLRVVALQNTQVTDTGVQQLQQALPNLSIMRGPPR